MLDPIRITHGGEDGFVRFAVTLARFTWVIGKYPGPMRWFADHVVFRTGCRVDHGPEQYRHFSEYKGLVRWWRDGGEPRVILTWSPYMLDEVDLETDQVLICLQRPGGGYVMREIDRGNIRRGLQDMAYSGLGQLWYELGDEWLTTAEEEDHA